MAVGIVEMEGRAVLTLMEMATPTMPLQASVLTETLRTTVFRSKYNLFHTFSNEDLVSIVRMSVLRIMTPAMTLELATQHKIIQVCMHSHYFYKDLANYDTAGSMCVAETDSTWMIMWEDTHAGYHDTQLCQSFIPISAGIHCSQ